MLRARKIACNAAMALSLSASLLFAQNAALRGNVSDAKTGEPLPQANVMVKNTAVAMGAASNLAGRFEIKNLSAGAYRVSVSFMGYEKQAVESLVLLAGEEKELNLQLAPAEIQLNPVVSSASRQQEKALEAPAAIAVVETKRCNAARR